MESSNLNTTERTSANVDHTSPSGIKEAFIWQCSGAFPRRDTAFDWREAAAEGAGAEELAGVRPARTPERAGRCTCGAGRRDREGYRAWR